MISVVSPVFRAVGCVAELHHRLTATLQTLGEPYEIVLVDDGSDDGSDDEIRAITDPHVRAMFLEENAGQQRAIAIGLQLARGEWIVVMDCDLQDPPEAIPRLWEVRADVVIARRTRRRGWRGIVSRLWRAAARIPRGVGNFSIVHRRVVDEIMQSDEPFLLQLLKRPYRTIDVPYAARFHGRSAYTLRKLLRHAARMR
ncbi:MAG TPA: glycosyltransferase [Thermoanaerobaculia bacterium]|nr:glycosyltransferase [Thermoanaerobaculia bacterium]